MTPRRWFHLLLGAIFIPCLSLPLVWGAAIYWLRRAVDVEDRRWAKRMLGLAIIDTMVVLAGSVLIVARLGRSNDSTSTPHNRAVIGVMPDESFGGPGAKVESVAPGGPAASAGIQPGDTIVRVAEKEVNGAEALRKVVGEQEAGVPVAIEMKRGTSTSAVEVTPVWSSQVPLQKVGLFDPPEGQHKCFAGVGAPRLLPWAVILLGIAVVGVLAARRGSGLGVWLTGVSLLGAGVGAYGAYGGTCVLLGGPTGAGAVFSLWGSSLGLAGTALVARKFVCNGQVSSPTRTWGSAVGLGGWYAITGALRLTILLSALVQLVPLGMPAYSVASFAQGLGTLKGPSLLLLTLPVVLFGPFGEEMTFRGLLQPSLSRWLSPSAAIAITSVIFASLHWYYGLMLPLVVFFGAILGWTRFASGSLRAPIVLHVLINGCGFLPILLRSMRGG